MPEHHLDADERAELERLRAEVNALRASVATTQSAQLPAARQRWRAWVAALVGIIGCVLLIGGTAAVWLRSEVTDTDRYVGTVAPLAHDPAVQQALANRITTEIFTRIDVAELVDEAAVVLADRGARPVVTTSLQGLAQPIAGGVEGFVHDRVLDIVASDRFAQAWRTANEAAHANLVALLTGERSSAGLQVDDNTVTINLAPFIAQVKARLVDAGFGLASQIPAVDAEFVLFRSDDITTAQRAFRGVDVVGVWLPVLAVVTFTSAVLIARERRRALIVTGVAVAVSMLVLAGTLALARPLYLDALPSSVDRDAAVAVFDQLVGFLRNTLRAVLVLGLVLALAAYLTGSSRQAVATRRGLARLSELGRRHAWRTGPVPEWIRAHKRPVQIAVAAAAVLVFAFWTYPSAGVIIGIALVAAVIVAAVEVIGADVDSPGPETPPPTSAAPT